MKDSEKILIRSWGKRDPCFVEEERLATLLPAVLWEIENISNKLVHFVKEKSRQNVESIN